MLLRPPGPRALAVAHFGLLVAGRALLAPDDVSGWDLISFLNARTAPLGELLGRPEVHFENPFSFPLYNVGSESAISAVLHAALGALSPRWSPLLVLLAYDLAFVLLVDRLFRRVLEDERARAGAWLLLSMSWITLTFASTQAFNMQAYCVIVLGLLGVELFVQGAGGKGALCLGAAFLLVSQGHALPFLLPYYAAGWAVFRAVASGRPRGLRSLAVVAVLALAVHAASGGLYLRKISPLSPYDAGNVLGEPGPLLSRAALFLRQSFWPAIRVDGVPIGFAPCLVYASAAALGVMAVRNGRWRPGPRAWLAGAAAAVLVAAAYTPSFLSPVVKSQRAVPADLLLVLVVALGTAALVRGGALASRQTGAVLLAAALVSDAVYLRFVLGQDHSRNHSPLFDFDLSDGVIRHDMEAAVRTMREQSDAGAALVVAYPRGASENTTDPAMLHARFLRRFGRLPEPHDVAFACHTCDRRYGCPFPERQDSACALRCCFADPAPAIRQARLLGRAVFLWWWPATPREVPSIRGPEALLAGLPGLEWRRFPLPAPVGSWMCFALVESSPAPDGEEESR